MREILKQRLTFFVKYIIGFILLAWILSRIDRRQMLVAMTDIHPSVLMLMLALAFANLAGQFFLWRYLVMQHSMHYRVKDLLPSFFAGFAFRMMIPGGHAEISKVFLMPGKKSGKVMAFGIEKFFQTYIKLILVLMALPLVFTQYRQWLWPLLVIAVAAYFFLPNLIRAPFLKRFHEKDNNHHVIFLRTLVYTLVIFFFLMMQYFLLLNDVHTIGFMEAAFAVIFIWGSGLIPISISGLGVRENFAAYFLAQYGIPPYAAVGVSLLIFAVNAVLPALMGLYFIYRRSTDLDDARHIFLNMGRQLLDRGKKRLTTRPVYPAVSPEDTESTKPLEK